MDGNIKLFRVSYTVTRDRAPRFRIDEIPAQETAKSYVFPGRRVAKTSLLALDHVTYDVPNFVNRFGFCLEDQVELLKKDIVDVVNGIVAEMKAQVLATEEHSKEEPTVTIDKWDGEDE